MTLTIPGRRTSDTVETAGPPVGGTRASRGPVTGRYRTDIEGLRALAVLLVVLYHFGFLGLTGGYVGVDVFFVISGYLITRQLAGAVAGGSRARDIIGRFYAGRFRRLLPAATITIAATIVLTYLFAPPLSRASIYLDAAFASIYSLNYRLAFEGTQYSQVGTAASPLQHFWSLGVEEQFYVVWPALLIVGALVFGRRWRAGMLATIGLITAVSLVLSYVITEKSQPWAYFSLHTRAWELGVGALLALAPAVDLGRRVVWANLVAAAGVVLVLWSAWEYTDATLFPGIAAVVPVLGSALVIAAAAGSAGGPMSWVLGNSLAQFFGRMSYSWYLWHWPLLVFAPYVIGRPLTGIEKLGLLLLTLVVATQSFWIVEQPTRVLRLLTPRWLVGGVATAGATVGVAVVLIASQGAVTGTGQAVTSTALSADASAAEQQVAEQLAASIATKDIPSNLTPTLDKASTDLSSAHTNGCHAEYTSTTNPACVYGDPTGSKVAVIFGDSHAEQWLPGLDAAGQAAGWKVVNWTKASCPFGRTTLFNSTLNRTFTECDTWRTATVARIEALAPDLVFVSGSENLGDGQISNADWVTQSDATSKQLVDAGLSLTFIQDIPMATSNVPGCLAQNLSSAQRCTFGSDGAYTQVDRHTSLAAGMAATGAKVVDPIPWLCAEGTCPVIVGNVLIYRDDNHVTATFSRWLAPVLSELLTTS